MRPALPTFLKPLVLFLALGLAHHACAQQSVPPAAPATAQAQEAKPTEEMGTGETLGFLGRKMWFEVRRRLNLTTEEEEKTQREAERNYRLRVGGIKLEK